MRGLPDALGNLVGSAFVGAARGNAAVAAADAVTSDATRNLNLDRRGTLGQSAIESIAGVAGSPANGSVTVSAEPSDYVYERGGNAVGIVDLDPNAEAYLTVIGSRNGAADYWRFNTGQSISSAEPPNLLSQVWGGMRYAYSSAMRESLNQPDILGTKSAMALGSVLSGGIRAGVDYFYPDATTPAIQRYIERNNAARPIFGRILTHSEMNGLRSFAAETVVTGAAGRAISLVGRGGIAAEGGTGLQSLDPTTLSFTQSSISFQKVGANYSLDTIAESMWTRGWIGKPIDVVSMPDGTLATIDNTRVLAARMAGIDVQANVRGFGEVIADPIRQATLTEAGIVPKTWGEAASLRINKPIQNATYPNLNPGWSTRFPYGAIYDPIVK